MEAEAGAHLDVGCRTAVLEVPISAQRSVIIEPGIRLGSEALSSWWSTQRSGLYAIGLH